MTDVNRNRALALAGLFQAAALVNQIANTGRCDESVLATCMRTLFKTEADNVIDVYGHTASLELGLTELTRLFESSFAKPNTITRYVFSLLYLERRLARSPELLTILKTGVERAKTQVTHFSLTHENVLANLAGLYVDTLSTFNFRIQITGQPLYLNSPYYLHKIRACLLAGIRSAVLWRQCGGHRWQLIFSKQSVLKQARILLGSISVPEATRETESV